MIYIIVLNWNGAADTIACAQSVLALEGTPFRLVICDNGSSDDSVDRIREWASGRCTNTLQSAPGYESSARGATNGSFLLLDLPNDPDTWQHPSLPDSTIVLVQTGANLGYAGGNNVGLRYALGRGDMEFAWILNNDTTVSPNALSALAAKARSDHRYGIVGSTLLYHYQPERVQVLAGCRFSAWTTTVAPVGWGKTAAEAMVTSEYEVESELDYVSGASVLVSKAFIADIGLMHEGYFLYFEEIDWAERGRRSATHSWKLGFARDSVVFHKVGASAQTGRSISAARYYHASKLRFMKRFYPGRLPITLLMMFMQVVKKLLAGQLDHARVILSVLAASRQMGNPVTDSTRSPETRP